jgi:selenocysteine lyase/cysteine desulfurase
VLTSFDFDGFRSAEFSRLDAQGVAYLDFAAAGLYGASQVAAFAERLNGAIYGNPHSEHGPSRTSARDLFEAKTATLAFFDADPALYDVCFTANTSAALKLVAESYPFAPGRGLVLSADNHNSVNGIREYARIKGAPVTVLPLDDELRLDDPVAHVRRAMPGLLAFPAQSNFSGVRHDLDLLHMAQSLGYDVLIDAAGTGACSGLSLREYPAEFLAFSFYKLFGLPTGLGALIAKRSALTRLKRPWFAGGTVDFVSVEHDRHQLRHGHEGFEDGTPDFANAGAIVTGFGFLARVDHRALAERLSALTARFLERATALTHPDGAPLVRIYGPRDMTMRGATVAFNILTPRGAAVSFGVVERHAHAARVAIRGGCFCNPGAAEKAFEFSDVDVAACLDRLGEDFTIPAFQNCLGPDTAVGALRLSVGLPTNFRDIDRALDLIASFGDYSGD